MKIIKKLSLPVLTVLLLAGAFIFVAPAPSAQAADQWRTRTVPYATIRMSATRPLLIGNARGQASAFTRDNTSFGVRVQPVYRQTNTPHPNTWHSTSWSSDVRGATRIPTDTLVYTPRRNASSRNVQFRTEFQRITVANGSFGGSTFGYITPGW